MILHLTGSTGNVDIHVHDDAHIEVRSTGLSDVPAMTAPAWEFSARRWLLTAVVGAAGIAAGYELFAPHTSSIPRIPAALTAPAGAAPSLSNNLASAPAARTPATPGSPLPLADPRTRSPSDVPQAVTQELARPPTVTPGQASTRPAQGANAFGLEN